MKKKIMMVLAGFIMTGAGILFQPGDALSHDVNVSFGINLPFPPAIVVTRPPVLNVIPGTPVFYEPEVDRQLYFYSGNWYRLDDGYWFRAAYNNGPWVYLSPLNVPYVFRDLSPRYYRVPPREQYRARWAPQRYWRPMEGRHYGDRDEWYGHHDNHDGRGFEGRRDWSHGRSNWRPVSDRHYEYRDKGEEHHDNRGGRGSEGHKDWKDDRLSKRWD